MGTFLQAFAASYIAATLLPSGAAHILRASRFSNDLRSHGVLPHKWSGAAAGTVAAAEVTAGLSAILSAVSGRSDLLLGGLALGALFFLYLIHLLKKPVLPASCSCSVLESYLTPFSIVPSAGLIVAALAGFAAGYFRVTDTAREAAPLALGNAWGVTISCLMTALPASMPEMHKVRR